MGYRYFRCVLGSAALILGSGHVFGLSLLERSPFVWPGFEANASPAQAPAQASSPSDVEFHAVYELSGKTHILVKNRRENKFHWLSLGEEFDGMLPKEYNREKDELLLAYDNQEKWLALQALPQASGTPVATAQPATPATTSRATSNTPRRRVIRPSSSSSSTRNVIRPASRSGSTVPRPPKAPNRRSFGNESPGVEPPSIIPPDPGPDPSSAPPDFLPSLPAGTTPPPKP